DVLEDNRWDILRGHRIGLITNVSGVDRAGNPTLDLLRSAPGVELVSVFTPEHGYGATSPFSPQRGEKVREARMRGFSAAEGSSPSSAFGTFSPAGGGEGTPVYSIYDTSHKPSREQLADLDTLVFDIQDAG